MSLRLINKARIESARSKVGPDSANFLIAEATLDICVDLEEVFPKTVKSITPEEQQALETFISTHIKDFLAKKPL